MKNLLVLSLLMSTSVFSATTGTLLLQGIVPQKISLIVTPIASASGLDLSASQTDLKVATVNEQSNSKTGYKVTVTSANLSKLKRTDGPEVFAYTMKYNGSAVALTSAAGTTVTSASTNANVNKDVSITYAGIAPELMVEGTYNDVVTFTIAAQ